MAYTVYCSRNISELTLQICYHSNLQTGVLSTLIMLSGWSSGAKVLGKLPVPGCFTYLD